MDRIIEVEMKFEILSPEQVELFLEQFTPVGEKRVVDTYLDTPGGKMFKRGIFIRIRDMRKLDFKFNQEDIAKGLNDSIEHIHCDEVSFPLPITEASLDGLNDTLRRLSMKPTANASLEEFIANNKLVKSITIDKRRRSYAGSGFHIDVDSVQGLGEYIEIEKMTDSYDKSAQIQSDMKRLVKSLDLKYIDTGYNELYWRKHNFELYLKGKYLLPEDRKKYRPASLK